MPAHPSRLVIKMSNGSIKRIMVALDAGEASKTTLQVATSLASRLHAELEALYVEDINLLRLAELPIAREVSLSSRLVRQLTPAEMEKQLRNQVERLRRYVRLAAQQANLSVELRVLRGDVASQLSLAVSQMDLLIIGKNTQLLRQSEKLGRTTQAVLMSSNCNVLLLQHGAAIERPVAVLFTGDEASQRTLLLGIQLAQGDHDQLCVLYPPLPEQQQQVLQDQVTRLSARFGITPRHIGLTDMHAQSILEALRTCQGRMFLLEGKPALLPEDQLQALLRQSRVPVILVR